MEPAGVHAPVVGSNNSALPKTMLPVPRPPETRTFPFVSRTAGNDSRGSAMLPVSVHVPGLGL